MSIGEGPFYELSFDADLDAFRKDCETLAKSLPETERAFRESHPDLWERLAVWERTHSRRGRGPSRFMR